MKISVEVSLYPLSDQYLPQIQKVVEKLNACEQVRVHTNGMSTQITGEFDDVMQLIQTEIRQTFETSDKAVFVCKFLNSELDI